LQPFHIKQRRIFLEMANCAFHTHLVVTKQKRFGNTLQWIGCYHNRRQDIPTGVRGEARMDWLKSPALAFLSNYLLIYYIFSCAINKQILVSAM
jgi:hypothetical protein